MATSKEMTAGPALPLIFNFTLPLLFGNLLQQTYSLVDAAIVGKFLGINALASAQLRFRQSATCCCYVCGHSHLYQYLLCGYPEDDAYTGEYL